VKGWRKATGRVSCIMFLPTVGCTRASNSVGVQFNRHRQTLSPRNCLCSAACVSSVEAEHLDSEQPAFATEQAPAIPLFAENEESDLFQLEVLSSISRTVHEHSVAPPISVRFPTHVVSSVRALHACLQSEKALIGYEVNVSQAAVHRL
jgi:hypothetical protein